VSSATLSFACAALVVSHISLCPRTICPRRVVLGLNLSSESPDAALGSKKEGRKNRVVLGYKLMTAAYVAAELLTVKTSGATTSLLCVLGGCIALPTGLSYILISAAAMRSNLNY
jgi:hypothetical protein